jgi:hypothetical protein
MIDLKIEKIKEFLGDEQNRIYLIGAATIVVAVLY